MAAEFVGIELELRGADGVYRDLQKIDTLLNTLGGRKQVKSGLTDLKKDVVATRGEIQKLERDLAEANAAFARGTKAFGKAWANSSASNFQKKRITETSAALDGAKQRLKDLQQAEREVQVATRNMGRTFTQEFNAISSRVAHIGSAMQSFGNALTRLTSPFNRLTTGLLYGAGYKALNMFTEGFSGAFERADTMKNYSRTLEAFGFSATEASKAIDELNESVIGLPTGLDEIVALQKKYVASSQDIEKSTKLAIATNNAFLASASDARQKKTAERIITQLAGGAEIASTSWDALQRAIPLVFTELAKDSKMGVSDYMKALKSGKISTDEFMESFSRLGKEGAIADAANVMKQSWAGLSANIQNATRRMGQGIIEALNDTFQDSTGRTLLQRLLGVDADGKDMGDGIKHWIDGLSESVQKWIKSHPEEILNFFEDLKSIDWKGLLKGFAEGMGMMLNLLQSFAKWASGKDLSKVGKNLYKMNLLGKALTILGGFLKGTRHIWGFLGAGGKFLANGKGVGIFGGIANFFGKKKDITAAGTNIEAAASTAGTIGKAAPKLVAAFKNMALLSGIVALPAVTGWVVTKGVKEAVKNFKETIDLFKDFDWSAAAKLAGGIIVFLGASAGLGALAGHFAEASGVIAAGEIIVGLITSIATAFFDLDMALIKDGIKNFADSIKYFNEIPDLSNFKGNIGNKIINAVDVLNEVSEALEGRYVDWGKKEGGLNGIGLFTGFGLGNLAKALGNVKKAAEEVNNLANINIADGIVDKVKKTIKSVTEVGNAAWNNFGGLFGGYGIVARNLDNLREAIKQLRLTVHHVNELANVKISDGAVKNVKGIIKQLSKAFTDTEVSRLRTSVTAFVAALKEAFAELEQLNQVYVIDATVKLSSDFDSSVKNTIKKIEQARKDIKRALDNIPTSYHKTITVNLHGRVNASDAARGISSGVSSAVSGLLNRGRSAIGHSRGGLIYRAKGGSVPFKRRGTDTVPAMLTPGEFVHNKQAVNTFGIDFMRKVNNLDVRGAMNELLGRAGRMANVNRGTVVNNTYNNNQKVVQNINTNSADFAFRSASRFVGAF